MPASSLIELMWFILARKEIHVMLTISTWCESPLLSPYYCLAILHSIIHLLTHLFRFVFSLSLLHHCINRVRESIATNRLHQMFSCALSCILSSPFLLVKYLFALKYLCLSIYVPLNKLKNLACENIVRIESNNIIQ